MTFHIGGGRGRTVALAASVMLLLLGAAVLTWTLMSQEPEPPQPAAADSLSQAAQVPEPTEADASDETASPDRSTAAATEPTDTTSEPTTSASEPPQTEQPDTPSVQPMARSTPESVTIPAIDVTSDLHTLGLKEDGTLQVPTGERYNQAAWYDGSPTPGELGPAVIEGHVTSQGSVPSVFFDLGELSRGDTVDVTRENGSVARFEVYATDSFPKDDFPKVAVYGNTDTPELRLITCGGDYDPDARAHVDNIVVFAKLVSG
ncbi:MAG: class F sortase [Ornithinimicrobium sp.]